MREIKHLSVTPMSGLNRFITKYNAAQHVASVNATNKYEQLIQSASVHKDTNFCFICYTSIPFINCEK